MPSQNNLRGAPAADRSSTFCAVRQKGKGFDIGSDKGFVKGYHKGKGKGKGSGQDSHGTGKGL